jgi:hypothetical protein
MKVIKRLMAIAVAVTLVVFLSGFATEENNAAAVVNEDSGCNIIDFDTWQWFDATLHSVTNHGGNSILICKTKDALGTGVEREWWGFGCNTYMGFTVNSYLVISEDGNATLRCIVNKPKE